MKLNIVELLWCTAGVLLAATIARGDEILCPVPLPAAHDNSTEYRSRVGPGVYTIRWHNPNEATGDVVSCHLKVGALLLVNYDPVPGLGCFSEDVSLLTGREVVDAWCEDLDGGLHAMQTVVRMRIPGKPPKLLE